MTLLVTFWLFLLFYPLFSYCLSFFFRLLRSLSLIDDLLVLTCINSLPLLCSD